MRKPLVAAALIAALSWMAVPALAAPPGLPEDNPNKNAIVVPVTCDGVNDGQPFWIWVPNANSFPNADTVGHPIDVDVPVGVGKNKGQGAAARAIECVTPLGPILVMPTGKP